MSDIAIFESDTGEIRVQLEKETVWLTQRQMGVVQRRGDCRFC